MVLERDKLLAVVEGFEVKLIYYRGHVDPVLEITHEVDGRLVSFSREGVAKLISVLEAIPYA